MTASDESMLAELEAELAALKEQAHRKHTEHEALERELAERRAGYAQREAN